ncbi:MAG: V-type ATPase 116kDa subunit family protein, partial [Promethearchaeota archaeon]
VRPFETITKLYGTPTYYEIDPTPIIAFTFPLLFGLMFGDIGHGIVLIISGLLGALVYRKRKGDILRLSWIIFFCGWAAFFVGFLYGEFLGHHEIEIFGNVLWDFEKNPIILPIIGSLNDPLRNILDVFYFAIIIGVFQINLGWFIQFLNYWKQKRKFLALSDSFVKILLLTGGAILLFNWGFDINSWIGPPYPILLVIIPGILLLLLKPLGKLFKISYLQEESFGGLLGEGSVEAFDTVLSVISNVASYIRLLALALAHIALLFAINAMAELIEGDSIGVEIVNIIGLTFGNIIVILLEGILVFINSLRLTFYEFFFKFYQGSGIEYFPFYLDNDYSVMKFSGEAKRDVIYEEIEREIDTKTVKEELEKAINYISRKFD